MSNLNRQVGTRPLAAIVPDLDALLADPAGYLRERELRIGGRRVPWWQFTFPPALFVIGILIPTRLGVALAIAGPVLLGCLIYWAWPVHREIVMRAGGVRFWCRDVAVWCPWSLFSSPGHAFVRKAGWLDTEITLPILFASIPLVECERAGHAYGKGHLVRAEHFWFLSDHEACLPSVYAMRPQDLGDLLLHLGRVLDGPGSVPAESFVSEAFSTRPLPAPAVTAVPAVDPRAVAAPEAARILRDAADSPAAGEIDIRTFPTADRNGWITVPVTRLRFAPRCCDCGAAAFALYGLRIDEGRRWLRLVPFYGRFRPEKAIDVAVPFCPKCRRKDYAWYVALIALSIFLGFAPLGILALMGFARLDVGVGIVLFIVSLFLAPFAELLERKPFGARYNDSERTVSLRFREGVDAEEMLS